MQLEKSAGTFVPKRRPQHNSPSRHRPVRTSHCSARSGSPPHLAPPTWLNPSRSSAGGGDGRRPWRRARGRRLPPEGVEHDGRALLPPRPLAPQHSHRHVRCLPRLHPHRHEVRRAWGMHAHPRHPGSSAPVTSSPPWADCGFELTPTLA